LLSSFDSFRRFVAGQGGNGGGGGLRFYLRGLKRRARTLYNIILVSISRCWLQCLFFRDTVASSGSQYSGSGFSLASVLSAMSIQLIQCAE